MYCPMCGKQVKDDANFCPYCAHPLRRVEPGPAPGPDPHPVVPSTMKLLSLVLDAACILLVLVSPWFVVLAQDFNLFSLGDVLRSLGNSVGAFYSLLSGGSTSSGASQLSANGAVATFTGVALVVLWGLNIFMDASGKTGWPYALPFIVTTVVQFATWFLLLEEAGSYSDYISFGLGFWLTIAAGLAATFAHRRLGDDEKEGAQA